jgi:tetratricopeptide (TPR) repeat protein
VTAVNRDWPDCPKRDLGFIISGEQQSNSLLLAFQQNEPRELRVFARDRQEKEQWLQILEEAQQISSRKYSQRQVSVEEGKEEEMDDEDNEQDRPVPALFETERSSATRFNKQQRAVVDALRSGDVDEGIGRIEAALAMGGDQIAPHESYNYHLSLGNLQMINGDMAAAEKHFGLALPMVELEGGLAGPEKGMAQQRCRRKQLLLLNNLGVVKLQQDEPTFAQKWLNDALQLDPLDADAHNNLGLVLQRLAQQGGDGRQEEDMAVAHFRKAVVTRPTFVDAHFNLGMGIIRRAMSDGKINGPVAQGGDGGGVDAGILHLAAALKLQPDDAVVLSALEDALALKLDYGTDQHTDPDRETGAAGTSSTSD